MKKDYFIIGIIFLGISLIISSFILSNALKQLRYLNGTLNSSINGSLVLSDNTAALYDEALYSSNSQNDILVANEAGAMLGYNDQDSFIQDIVSGKLEDIPCIKVDGSYVFSKKALEEWVYSKSLK